MRFLKLDFLLKLKKFLDPNIPFLHSSLKNSIKNDFEVADVGSAGGSPEELNEIFNKCKFTCFEPDRRAITPQSKNISVMPYGLFSSNTKKDLFLTNWPEASSIFEPNKKFLNKFLSSYDHEVIRKKTINLKTLDELFISKKFDYLKVDAEGADLDILKGGDMALKECLGVKIEVQFKERNIGSPFFGQVDSYLSKDFYLSSLEPFLWLKTKNYFINSNPEIVCGDAFYLRSFSSFLKIFNNKHSADKKNYLIKYVTLSVLFGAHDSIIYFLKNYDLGLSRIDKETLISGVKKSKKNILYNFVKSVFVILLFIILYIISFPLSFFRKKFKIYIKKNVFFLGKIFKFLGSNPEAGKQKK